MSDAPKMVYLGAKAQRLRVLEGLTLVALADLVNTSAMTIRRAETGESTPGPATVVAIAEALGVNVAELYKDAS